MNTLRQAVEEYLAMRRSLGFKLNDAGRSLLDFASFMHRHRAPHITQALALTWAQQSRNAEAAYWAQRVTIPRQSRGPYDLSRSKRLFGGRWRSPQLTEAGGAAFVPYHDDCASDIA